MDRSSAHRDRMIGVQDEISSCFQEWASEPNQLLKALDNLDGVGLVIASGLIFSANRNTMVPFDQYTTGWCGELISYMWRRKMWWMMPIVIVLLLFGLLIGFGSSSGVGPFIYTLF